MKQKKYLWRRIFALSLALLLCLNTATAYAAPDTPTGSESTEAVSDVSVNEGDSNLTNKTEDTGKGTETEKPETEEGNKDSGDADSETGDADENGKNTANKPTEGKPDGSDGKDIVSDASDTDTLVTDTSSEEKQPGEDTPKEETPEEETPEEEPEEMPEEVKAFLDAVARIPGEITPENLEEAGALLTAALDAYDVLTEAGYGERSDVAEAYIRVEAAYAEVQAALGDEEPVLYAAVPQMVVTRATKSNNVEKSGINYTFYSVNNSAHFTADPAGREMYPESAKGEVKLTGKSGSGGSRNNVEDVAYIKLDGYRLSSSDSAPEITGSDPNIMSVKASVNTQYSSGQIEVKIEFAPGYNSGHKPGEADVQIKCPFTYKSSRETGTGYLYLSYHVTNGVVYNFTNELMKTPSDVEKAIKDGNLRLNSADITTTKQIVEGNEYVEIPEDEPITLLYAITVEGSEGMKYKVRDDGAIYEGGDEMEATIPPGGKAVIYMTGEFWADDIDENGYLRNAASLTANYDTFPSSTATIPARVFVGDTNPDDNDETYTVTINFLEKGTNATLRESVELTGSVGDSYECLLVDEEKAGSWRIPKTITKDGKTYSLKEGQDSKLSGTVNGDVVIDLYYSSPEAPQDVLTVTAEDVSVIYDGGGHPVNPVAKVGDDEATEAVISVVYVDAEGNEFSDAPVNAGTYKAKVTAKLDGYDDATCEATVTIAKRKLTVTTGSDSKTYDGTPLTNSIAIVVVEGGAVAGEEITATATGSRTEVGSAENTFVLNWGNASESNYEIVERRLGTLTVYAAGGTSNDNPEPTPPGPTPPGTTPPGSEPTPSGTTPAEPGPTPPGPTPATPEPTPTIPVLTVEPVPVVPTTVVPTPAAPTATAALVSSTPEAAVLMDEDVPLANEEEKAKLAEVGDGETPLAGGKGASWALVNFALMNLAIFESLMLLIGYFVNTKNDKEVEEEKRKLKKKGIFRIVSLPIAIISLIAFILTEDITLPTAFVDKYTIVMLIIAVVQTVVVALSNKKYEEEEEEEERKDLQFAVG